MVENVARHLRDGVALGEQAPAVMVRDSLDTRAGSAIFNHFFTSLSTNIGAGRAQAQGLVAVALRSTPENYNAVLPCNKSSFNHGQWLQVVDCYTDPLGWNDVSQGAEDGREEDSEVVGMSAQATVCHDISNLTSLLTIILKSGQASVPQQVEAKFVVLIDSMSVLLRYHTVPVLANFLSTLRSCEQVSAMMWLLHADLHDSRVVAGMEYLATTVVYVEAQAQLSTEPKVLNLRCGRVRTRTKKRNGQVREQVEVFHNELQGINFTTVTLLKEMNPSAMMKPNTPKVQFNLGLSEKELEDRSKVILPYEHQGGGKEVQIYDGRPDFVGSRFDSLAVTTRVPTHVEPLDGRSSDSTGVGKIHYLRDSDDERPDSDEDPDDDLDI